MRGGKGGGEGPDRNMSAFWEMMIETQISFKHWKTGSYAQNPEFSSPTAQTFVKTRLRFGRCCSGRLEFSFLPTRISYNVSADTLI
jgi:hypothetical protein